MNSQPEIRCTRCDSTVPWAPFCSRCGAYLEFVGRPPWHPDEPESGPMAEEIVTTTVVREEVSEEVVVGGVSERNEELAASEEGYSLLFAAEQPEAVVEERPGVGQGMSAVIVGILVIGVVGGLGLTFLTNGWIGGMFALVCLAWAIVLMPRRGAPQTATPERRRGSGRGIAAVLVLVIVGVVGGFGLAHLTNEWIGAMFGLVCAAWAVALWPRRGVATDPDVVLEQAPEPTREQPIAVEDVTEVIVVESILERVTEPDDVSQVVARAPQVIPPRSYEVPISQGSQVAAGDIPCLACGELNVQGRHFCAWCGAVMPEVLVAPATVPHLEQEVDPGSEADSRGRSPRLSRSWRVPIVVGTLAFVFLSAVILAVFGPFAFQFRLGTTQIFQAINQFIDPYSGNQTDIEGASASSSLRGTTPRAGVGNDASDFWASESSSVFGAGNTLTATFDRPYTINRAVVIPGIQSGLFDVLALATPAKITLIFDDGSTVTHVLDKVQLETDTRQLINFPKTTTQSVTMRIDSVYLPREVNSERMGEVAVSGMYFLEPPRPPAIISVPTEVRRNPALPGTTN